MLTTCPECHTTFRVSQAQLDHRRGLVRCGRCSAVFNAYDTLLPELATPVQAEAQPSPAAGPPTETPCPPAPVADRATADFAPAQGQPPSDTVSVRTAQTDRPDDDAFLAAWLRTPPQTTTPSPQSATSKTEAASAEGSASTPALSETAEAILLSALPTGRKRGLPGWQSLLWVLASIVLTLSFVLQTTYFLRAEIAAAWPATRPFIADACRRLGCSLPLPQDLSALRFEASSLETDPEDASRATLRLSLSNRSDRPIAWPHLILILTDVRDMPVAQRPFTPSEFLTDAADEARGMAPGEEREIRLDLQFKGLTAYGYKLDKRYP